MVNGQWSMFNLFTSRRFRFVLGAAQGKLPRALGHFCRLPRPQIPSFIIDATKVRIFHCGLRILPHLFCIFSAPL